MGRGPISRRDDQIMPVNVLADGLGFVEGPVILDDGSIVATSIDTGCIWRVDHGGTVERVAWLGGGPNGACLGPSGLLYVAQNGGKWPGTPTAGVTGGVQVVDFATGSVRWLTQDPISPNDLCFGPDDLLYITDPTRVPTRDDGRIWRCDPDTGECELLASLPWYPNGIGFGPDGAVYVASTGEQRIVRSSLDTPGWRNADVVVQLEHGHPDGFAFDMAGNLYIGAVSLGDEPGDIQVWSTDGTHLDSWRPGMGHYYTNLAIAGMGRVVVCDSEGGTLLVTSRWPGVQALALHPFRDTFDGNQTSTP